MATVGQFFIKKGSSVVLLRSLNMKSDVMSKGWIWMSYMETVMPFWWSLEIRVRVCCAVHTYERPAGVTRADSRWVLAVCFPAGEKWREELWMECEGGHYDVANFKVLVYVIDLYGFSIEKGSKLIIWKHSMYDLGVKSPKMKYIEIMNKIY